MKICMETEFNLTPRELEIIDYVIQGFTSKQIAKARDRAEKTVKFHLTNIYSKTKLKTRAQLIVFVHNNQLRKNP